MIETLVLGLCINVESRSACDEALRAYYYQKPLIKEQLLKQKRAAERIAGKALIRSIPYIVAAAADASFQINFSRNMGIKRKNDETLLVLSYSF